MKTDAQPKIEEERERHVSWGIIQHQYDPRIVLHWRRKYKGLSTKLFSIIY